MGFLPESTARSAVLILVGVFFCLMGATHFTSTELFVPTVPPYLPEPVLLVQLSGVFEILGGLGVLLPRTRRLAGYGLLALLAAVYPANIHMALHPEQFPDIPAAALYGRLPFQFLFAAAVWYGACSSRAQSGVAASA